MSYIADCRTDENYNQKYLNEKDAEFVSGYDWCARMSVDNFFNNLECYEGNMDIDGEDINLVKFFGNHPKIAEAFKASLLHWIESNRDDLIISMIENMDDEEYADLKAKADQGNYTNAILRYEFEQEEEEDE